MLWPALSRLSASRLGGGRYAAPVSGWKVQVSLPRVASEGRRWTQDPSNLGTLLAFPWRGRHLGAKQHGAAMVRNRSSTRSSGGSSWEDIPRGLCPRSIRTLTLGDSPWPFQNHACNARGATPPGSARGASPRPDQATWSRTPRGAMESLFQECPGHFDDARFHFGTQGVFHGEQLEIEQFVEIHDERFLSSVRVFGQTR